MGGPDDRLRRRRRYGQGFRGGGTYHSKYVWYILDADIAEALGDRDAFWGGVTPSVSF